MDAKRENVEVNKRKMNYIDLMEEVKLRLDMSGNTYRD